MTLTPQEIQRFRDIRIHYILGVADIGRNLMLKCPLHADGTPSFLLDPDNKYKCFGCNAKGSGAIDFVMAKLECSFNEALEELVPYL